MNLQVKEPTFVCDTVCIFTLQLCVNTFLSFCSNNREISYLLQHFGTHWGWEHDYYFYFILLTANIFELQMFFSGFKLPVINMKWIIIPLPENQIMLRYTKTPFIFIINYYGAVQCNF